MSGKLKAIDNTILTIRSTFFLTFSIFFISIAWGDYFIFTF